MRIEFQKNRSIFKKIEYWFSLQNIDKKFNADIKIVLDSSDYERLVQEYKKYSTKSHEYSEEIHFHKFGDSYYYRNILIEEEFDDYAGE